jgi:hypothetical protein
MISTPALLGRAPHERHQPREKEAGFTRQCGEPKQDRDTRSHPVLHRHRMGDVTG